MMRLSGNSFLRDGEQARGWARTHLLKSDTSSV